MTNTNTDKTAEEVSILPQEQTDISEKSKKLSKATPNWRKRLRRTVIATALPLMSIASGIGTQIGDIPKASGVSEDHGDIPEIVYSTESVPSYIYSMAENTLTLTIPLPPGGQNVDDLFQLQLGQQLAPEQFSSSNYPSPYDQINPMGPPHDQLGNLNPPGQVSAPDQGTLTQNLTNLTNLINKLNEMSRMVNENLPSDTKKEEDEINRTVNEYRQQNPDFYNELHDGYFKSVRSFNKGIQIDKSGRLLESTGIKVPKVSVLMAELRLNQMLGGIINNDS